MLSRWRGSTFSLHIVARPGIEIEASPTFWYILVVGHSDFHRELDQTTPEQKNEGGAVHLLPDACLRQDTLGTPSLHRVVVAARN
jgi:hypothetical protein